MPSASAKLEKQTSQEVMDPLKQVLTMIEHKKRNLEKRKVKKLSDNFDGFFRNRRLKIHFPSSPCCTV